MGSESIAHEAEGHMGYWLRGHKGERNNIIIVLVNPTSRSKISRIKKVKLVKVRLQSVCASKSPHFSLLVSYNI